MRNTIALSGALGLALAASSCGPKSADTAPATKAAGDDQIEVKLCDDHTTTEIPADMERTRENGQKVADSLMAQWRRANPDVPWEQQEKAVERSWTIQEPADNSDVLKGQQADAQTYGQYTERDVMTWSQETKRLVYQGAQVFHDAEELGSTIAVSCDMCHPDGANTHPETYPKFQVQLGRVVLLRDMINWCLEHPVRAEPMDADDPRMRAMEAYIWAQRRGVELNYGKH